MTTKELLIQAKAAKSALAAATEEQKNAALAAMADCLEEQKGAILAANAADVENARATTSETMLDRLRLTEKRIADMARGIRDVIALPDPVGRVLSSCVRPNGLTIEKVSVPIGVVAIIFESRPNVASDAAALTVKSGNVCVLRSGRQAQKSCLAIVAALQKGLERAGLPARALALVEDASRESAKELMTANGLVDLLIPRGGKGLIDSCVQNATVPCIQTGTGICHIYVDKYADFDKALAIVANAKTSRPSVCNAAEVCLVHRDIAPSFLPLLQKTLTSDREQKQLTPVRLKCDERAYALIGGEKAGENDFDTEFLDYILAVGVADDVDAAIAHIAAHSTGHSESIVTEDKKNAARFLRGVDSAAVYVNASTRFTDGGEFGLGCEIGISTQKLHARGPMGLAELCSYKYIIRGDGQIR